MPGGDRKAPRLRCHTRIDPHHARHGDQAPRDAPGTGDVIMTRSPGEPEDLHLGDTVEVEIEGIGVLRNSVVAK